jgi:hypothetical protein
MSTPLKKGKAPEKGKTPEKGKAPEEPIPADPYLRHPKERERLALGIYADDVWRYQYLSSTSTVSRPGFNTTGREVDLKLNAYPITQFPTRSVWQYDVSIFPPHSINFQDCARCYSTLVLG